MRRVSGLCLIIGLLVALEVACRQHWLDPVYFPAPSSTGEALAHLVRYRTLWVDIGSTLWRAAVGFAVAMMVAVPTGLAMGEFQPVRTLLEPIVDVLRPMPSAAVIPVAILIFGIEDRMKVVVIIFGCVWPTIISTLDGIQGVDPLLIDTGRLLQLNRAQQLLRVTLPAAMPSIITGMRISLAIGLILAVTSEMIAGSNGLGYFILDSERSFAFKEMYAGIAIVGLLGYLASRAFAVVDRAVLFWYYASRARSGSDWG